MRMSNRVEHLLFSRAYYLSIFLRPYTLYFYGIAYIENTLVESIIWTMLQ